MDGPGRKIPGAEALGSFDVSDLKGRLAPGELRELVPSPTAYTDFIPQPPPPQPPPWWQNQPATPGAVPTPVSLADVPAAKWARENLGPSTVQWWYRENGTQVPNTAATRLQVGQEYTVPPGQVLGLLNVVPTLFYTVANPLAVGVPALALAYVAAFRLIVAGRSALDSEHVAPTFGGGTDNRWDTSIFNSPMFWGDSSVRVPFTIYAREGEKVNFELLATSLLNIWAACQTLNGGAVTSVVCGYRAMGVLFPMSYLP